MHNLHIAGADRPVIVCSPYSQAAVANDRRARDNPKTRPALTARVPGYKKQQVYCESICQPRLECSALFGIKAMITSDCGAWVLRLLGR